MQSSTIGTRDLLAFAVYAIVMVAGQPEMQAGEVKSNAIISEAASNALEVMASTRTELVSGVFQAIGYKSITHSDGRPAIQYPSQVTCHFDYSIGCWRYETREIKSMGVNSSSELTAEVMQQVKDHTYRPTNQRPRPLIAIFARTPEYMVEWSSYGDPEAPDHSTSHVRLRPPNVRPDTFLVHPFSPLACGLFDRADFENGGSISEMLQRYASKADSVDSEVDDSGKIRVVYSQGTRRRVIVIDPSQGYSVVSMSRYFVDESGEQVSGPGADREQSSATWERKSDVWIPVQFAISAYRGQGFTHEFKYDLDWRSVNSETTDPKIFTYKSFDIPFKGIQVYDSRGAKSVHIDTIGEPFVNRSGVVSPPAEDAPIAKPVASGWPFRYWVVIGNVILGLICVFVAILRRKATTK